MRSGLRGGRALYIAAKPCLNPKNNKSPKFGTVRNDNGTTGADGSAPTIGPAAHETRRLPLPRTEDARGSGRGAGGGRAGRRPGAGGRAEPGADHGVPAGEADAPRRHQRHQGTGADHGRRRQAPDRRLRAPCGVLRAGVRGAARTSCSRPSCASIAHHPIRTRGTFCGSVAHADPASEWCAVVATLDAEMVARSNRGTRIIAAKDYFDGIMTTALDDEELLTEVRLPLLAGRHPRRLPGILPPRRRLRAEHGGRDLSPRGRQDRRRARRHWRRRAVSAPHRRGRSRAERQVARTGGVPGRGRGGRRGDRPA